MLIDSGSTNNFIDLVWAKRLGLKLTPIKPHNVSVADGFKLSIHCVSKEVYWCTHGVSFKGDFLAMPIGGFGIVLGVQ